MAAPWGQDVPYGVRLGNLKAHCDTINEINEGHGCQRICDVHDCMEQQRRTAHTNIQLRPLCVRLTLLTVKPAAWVGREECNDSLRRSLHSGSARNHHAEWHSCGRWVANAWPYETCSHAQDALVDTRTLCSLEATVPASGIVSKKHRENNS